MPEASTPRCPSCQRPVAVARAACLYCGAPLPSGIAGEAGRPLQNAAPAGAAAPPPAERASRQLVVIDVTGLDASLLATAAELPAYEAAQLVRRGGLHLWRALPAAAEGELLRLREAGLHYFLVDEAEARVQPLRATAGERSGGELRLRTEEGAATITSSALLLIVTGAITRQRQASSERPKVETTSFEPSFCVHLHRSSEPRPIEIDASSFEPGFAPTGSTLLELRAWLDVLALDAPRDDGFRWLVPALAPAIAPPASPLTALDSLHARTPPAADPQAAMRGPSATGKERLLLDNLAQFRFYSGWRAAIERRRRRASAGAATPIR